MIFSVGSGNAIPSLDLRMGMWGIKLTKSMTTFCISLVIRIFYREDPIASREWVSQMRRNITRVLSDKL